ncbi:hypothetical protein PDIP_33110 [Penicillium digitatum Pd1]|uniref:Uncharacterized protein n=1 Tax=Penicillium digitatum (strain Pd1 / CECT 20795) TaxID=1170230 RepID=K9G7Y4_PEND1|nr:hypothetical protein PDIP_33110 [Penicillium digitatum Pd1]EKV17112.1 hypothetical protein PDIP_33110 [Penicillium digitatum Pd1]
MLLKQLQKGLPSNEPGPRHIGAIGRVIQCLYKP